MLHALIHPRALFPLLLIALAAFLVAGCGDDSAAEFTGVMTTGKTTPSTGSGSGDNTAPSGKVAAVDAKLTVRLENIGAKTTGGVPIPTRAQCTRSIPASCNASLTCPVAADAPEGDLELCTWIAETPVSVLTQPPSDSGQVCTQIYGGPETATITGTRDGDPIQVSYSRVNGCEIARWDLAAPLWTGDVPPASDGAPRAIDGNGTGGPSPDAMQPEIITDPIR